MSNKPVPPTQPPEEITIEATDTAAGWVGRADEEGQRALALLGAPETREVVVPRARLAAKNDPAGLDHNCIEVCKAFGGKNWHRAPYRWGVVFEGKEIFWHPVLSS